MNNYQKLLVVLMAIAVTAFLLVSSWADTKVVFGQPQSKQRLVKPSVSGGKSAPDSARGDSSAFGRAAAANADLKNSLKWTFGKRQQTGWHLYVPLIQHTVRTESSADSIEFARALSVWQKEKALAPHGILEGKTFAAMFRYWQSRRMPKIFEAKEETLLNAPSVDFFDPTRDAILRNVERETYAAYKKMIAAAAKDLGLKMENGNLTGADNYLKIISAHRSRAYQEQLRKKEPNAGRAQLAFTSPHFTGRALDIYVGGEPVTTRDDNRAIQIETRAYKWLVKNAERFGFYPYFYEPWHWEYVP